MSIDKSIRQHYDVPETKKIKGQLHKLAYITNKEAELLQKFGGQKVMTPEKIPAYPGHHGSSGSSAGVSQGGGGHGGGGEGPRGGHHHPPARPTPVTTAVASPSILSRPTPREAPPGEKGGAGYVSPEELRNQEIKNLIAKQQEEKFGDTADPTKFGETISDIDRITSKPESDWTIDDKLKIEEWENEQDYEKVKELADRGESFQDIQKAMDKGLLLKQDSIRRQGLIERGLAAIKPETRLESSLTDTVKKTFDPRKLATNYALKKMGLSWLNPLAGLASLFFPKQTAAVKSRFGLGQRPKDMSAFNRLGLLANTQPTDTIQQARVGQGTIGSDIVAGTKGILESGQELLGLKDIEGQQAVLGKAPLIQMRMLERKIKAPDIYGKPTPKEERMYKKLKEMQKEEKVYKLPLLTAADGGRIDKALGGRVRDI